MDTSEDSGSNTKISDSAYSNSCSNSQSRRSRSSKSTHSGSNSSGSSGYGGKPSTSGSSSDNLKLTTKKDKAAKKKKQSLSQLSEVKAVEEECLLECSPPEAVPSFDVNKKETHDVVETTPPLSLPENTVENMPVSASDLSTNKDETKIATILANVSLEARCQVANTDCDGFSCAISMHDGVVRYTTHNLSTKLGFPKDMWIGRSFIDFVHTKDRSTFASQITNVLACPEAVKAKSSEIPDCTMVCRVRRYRSLSISFGVKAQAVAYLPFLLKFSFKDFNDDDGKVVYLIIKATSVYSAFTTRNESIVDATPFTMRHSATGIVKYIDIESVPYLGYLPQDIQDQNALLLYHPEDLPYLKTIYETIVKEGSVVKSLPYRILAQNGDYIKLETEWSSFINPWSKKLEFIIGKHRILEGPATPNVFQSPQLNIPSSCTAVKDRINAETAELYRESILRMLSDVLTKPAEEAKLQISKRCQNLATMLESLLEEQPKPDEELKVDAQHPDPNTFDKDSVMLGGISPHNDFIDSKSSPGTPMSYTQLNYNENLQRYFDSNQSYCFDKNTSLASDHADLTLKDPKPLAENTSNTSLMSLAQYSNESVEMGSLASLSAYKPQSSSPPANALYSTRLTESLLTKHNNEMQKKLAKNHREFRYTNRTESASDSRQKKREHLARCNASFHPTTAGIAADATEPHGLKRVSKSMAEVVPRKRHCSQSRPIRRRMTTATAAPVLPTTTVTVTSTVNSTVASNVNSTVGVIPMYYAPAAASTTAPMGSSHWSHAEPLSHQMPPPLSRQMPPTLSNQIPPPLSHQMPPPLPHQMQPFPSAPMSWLYSPQVYGTPYVYPQVPYNIQPHQAVLAYNHPLELVNQSLNPMRLGDTNYLQVNKLTSEQQTANKTSQLKTSAPSCQSGQNSDETLEKTDGESSYSSLYSSFFNTESSSAEESSEKKSRIAIVKKNPIAVPSVYQYKPENSEKALRRTMQAPWLEQVCMTSELIYKYQIKSRSKEETLQADKERMKTLTQSPMVNEQLGQLYLELQLEGVAARLTLEEGITSSSSSGEDSCFSTSKSDTLRSRRNYSRLNMIYDEDAPLPPPTTDIGTSSGEPSKHVN